jgi:hypothetical protein
VATEWYNNHLSESQSHMPPNKRIQVILLTDDVSNRTKAIEAKMVAYSVKEYVESLADHPALSDKLSRKEYEVDSKKESLFPPHLTPMQIHEGVKAGRL